MNTPLYQHSVEAGDQRQSAILVTAHGRSVDICVMVGAQSQGTTLSALQVEELAVSLSKALDAVNLPAGLRCSKRGCAGVMGPYPNRNGGLVRCCECGAVENQP